MLARIYQPSKTAMQSGHSKSTHWVLEYEPERPRHIDPLMGWTSSGDMKSQIRLEFESVQEAVAYAKKHNIPHQVFEARPRKRVIKSYSDNFKYGRVGTWTH